MNGPTSEEMQETPDHKPIVDHPVDATSRVASIAAIIVTRNRLALLQESVAAVRAQKRALDEIIVINNDSDDGTRQWLEEQDGLTVIHQGNLGGAGGFYRGIKEGYARGHDWFWCMDDDTIAQPETLERLCAAPPFRDSRTGFLGSLVQWTDGSIHKMNMWLSLPGGARDVHWFGSVLDDGCVPAQTSSFVSILIHRRAVERVGLPIKEMFIWADDAEYTYRISQHFSGWLVLKSIALHKTPINKDSQLGTISPSEYFKLSHGLRNDIYFRRVQKTPLRSKMMGIGLSLLSHTRLLLKHRAPFYLMRSLWSGLFFSPRIETVRPTPPKKAQF